MAGVMHPNGEGLTIAELRFAFKVLDRLIYTGAFPLSTHDSVVLIDAAKSVAALVLRQEQQAEVSA